MRCVILLWSKYDLNEIKLLLILLVDPLKASEIQQVMQRLGASRAEQTLSGPQDRDDDAACII